MKQLLLVPQFNNEPYQLKGITPPFRQVTAVKQFRSNTFHRGVRTLGKSGARHLSDVHYASMPSWSNVFKAAFGEDEQKLRASFETTINPDYLEMQHRIKIRKRKSGWRNVLSNRASIKRSFK
jgi:hypothetical protein